MPTLNRSQIPPPKNWQDFESLCRDLWSRLWDDNQAQQNGRDGQSQHGVDVFGRPGRGKEWAGLQCKLKDGLKGSRLERTEMETEIEKARDFKPALTSLTFATTGPRDAVVQADAREITSAQLRNGSFSVEVYSWDDIVEQLADYPDLVAKHYPEFGVAPVAMECPEPSYPACSRAETQEDAYRQKAKLRGGRWWATQPGMPVVVGMATGALAVAALLSSTRPPPVDTPALCLTTPSEAQAIRSLAVRPLVSFTEECWQDFFADGLTEMLIADLAYLGPPDVISIPDLDGSSTQSRADAILEGSALRSEDRLWISIQLVDSVGGQILWGGTYERELGDSLDLQRELSLEISHQIISSLAADLSA